jgi:hypothetical protein
MAGSATKLSDHYVQISDKMKKYLGHGVFIALPHEITS